MPKCNCNKSGVSHVTLWVLALISSEIPRTALAQCHYTITDIPNPPGWWAQPRGINNLGHAAGTLVNGGDSIRAYFWSPGTGTVVLPLPPGYSEIGAYDLNDADEVVGYVATTSGVRSGFIWDGVTYTLIPPPAWANWVVATGINNNRQVCGTILHNGTGPNHVFLWHNETLIDLGGRPDFSIDSQATDVSAQGRVAGRGYGWPINYWHAFTFDDEVEWLFEPPIVVWGSEAYGVADGGFTCGRGFVNGPGSTTAGLMWTPSGTSVIVPPPQPPFSRNLSFWSVNSSGQAVGEIYGIWGVLWQNGALQYLDNLVDGDPPANHVSNAADINDAGQILASLPLRTAILNPTLLAADLTGDCHVTMEDLVVLLVNFGQTSNSKSRGDIDLDGEVGLSDLALLLSDWGE